MKSYFIKKIKAIPLYVWILFGIILIGIFLRTYHFREWLMFRGDQTRDSYLVEQVINENSSWPLLGPYMNNSGDSKESFYHMGPVYYYFQILSGKIFGTYPDKFAYPDVFFSILSIPFFYVFLKIYFERNLSLSITALYAVSSYFIYYSRFAWNTNLIPFFVILFFLSLLKFLNDKEKISWLWVVALGFALGVGFQLHAITMILFSIIAFFVFLFSIKKNLGMWKKWVVVFFVFIVLNTGQIIYEGKTGFDNTKRLFNFSSQENAADKNILTLLRNTIDCNKDANFLFISSYGNSNCSYGLANSNIQKINLSKIMKDAIHWIIFFISIIFSASGYLLFFHHTTRERDPEKLCFLRVVAAYTGVFFLIMIPLSTQQFDDLRYFVPIFFLPFLFLGFLIKFLSKTFNKKYAFPIIIVFFMLLFYSNFKEISSQVSELSNKNRTCSSHSATLGELESVVTYITAKADGQKNIYIGGNKELAVAINPLAYVLKKQGLNPIIIKSTDEITKTDIPAFFVSCRSKMKDMYPYEKISHIYVYQITKN